MNAPKYCVDCRHFLNDEYRAGLGKCTHPDSHKPSRVAPNEPPYASHERDYGHCGREGKHFETRPTPPAQCKGFWRMCACEKCRAADRKLGEDIAVPEKRRAAVSEAFDAVLARFLPGPRD